MDSFKIEWRKSAVKEQRRIDRPIILRILSVVEQLARDPYPTGTRKLQGADYTYRIRIGDYRLVYEVDNTLKIITISRIRHRKDVYRR